MRHLLRPLDSFAALCLRLADWIKGGSREPTRMEIPAIDADGDRCWITMAYQPHPRERLWAMSTCLDQRAAYAIHAVTQARAQAKSDLGWQMGWE